MKPNRKQKNARPRPTTAVKAKKSTQTSYRPVAELDIQTKTIFNTYSLLLLQPLMAGKFLPLTSASMSPLHLYSIVTDIVLNRRKKIIEFGAGISTVIIARLLKTNNLEAHLTSIDHDGSWIEVLRGLISNEGLDSFVTLIHAPLRQQHSTVQNSVWYDKDILTTKLVNKRFDIVVVDGPPAFQPGYEQSRFSAMPFIYNQLEDDFAVYLDDANRAGEQLILNKWKQQFGIDFRIKYGGLGYLYRGHSFHLGLL